MLTTPTGAQRAPHGWPRATLAIIGLCCLIFFGYQLGDSSRYEACTEFYQASGLIKQEFPLYETYLRRQGRDTAADQVMDAHRAKDTHAVFMAMGLDLGFYEELSASGERFWEDDVYTQWQSNRLQLNKKIRKVSTYRWGLAPGELKLSRLMTHLFLHADWLSLASSMLLLFLVGLSVETTIGSTKLAFCYLACGIMGGLVDAVFNTSNSTPLVGSSAGIAGVVAIFLGFYGLKKMCFSYGFGSFPLPAWALLPCWLVVVATEVILTNLHFAVPLAGLITGGVITLILRKNPFREKASTPEYVDDDETLRQAIQVGMDQISALEFDDAKAHFKKLLETHPSHPALLEQLYHLEKFTPESEAFHQQAHAFFEVACKDTQAEDRLPAILNDYQYHAKPEMQLPDDLCARIALKLSATGVIPLAESMLKFAHSHEMKSSILAKASLTLAKQFDAIQDSKKAERYRYLADLFKPTDSAVNASL